MGTGISKLYILAPASAQRYNHFMNAEQQTKLLEILASELTKLLGEKLNRLILYGSYARGEARPDSDLDLLILLNGQFDYATLIYQTSELVSRLSLEYDVVISRAFISKDRFETELSPFTMNVPREGIPI